MVLLFGMFGILQMMFVPGAILYRIFNEKWQQNSWLNLSIIVSLSLIFNCVLAMLLTSFHIYLPQVLRSIFIIEIFILLFIYPRFWQLHLFTKSSKFSLTFLIHPLRKEYTKIFFWVLLLFLVLWLGLWVHSWGQVFGVRDPSVSYNIWAIAWANNQFPTMTWHYPQLMSTNWSIPYVMIGSLPNQVVLEMFPASMNVFFPVLMLMMFFALFQQGQQRAYLIAGIIISLFMLSCWVYIDFGYVDWICAFLNLLTLVLISQIYKNAKFSMGSWLQIIFIAAAAALTKPAGIYTALFVPVLMLMAYQFKHFKSMLLFLLSSYILLILIVAPWYIYAQQHILAFQGSHYADISFLTWNIFRNSSWLSFFDGAILFGWPALIFLIFGFLFANALPKFWRTALYIYAPYFFIWAFLFSYDPRNLDFILPVLAIVTGLIIAKYDMDIKFIKWLKIQIFKFNTLGAFLAIILAFFVIIVVQVPHSQKVLIQHEIDAKNQIYNMHPGVVKLIQYADCPGFSGQVLDVMLVFNTMPALAPHMVSLSPNYFGPDMLPQVFNNAALLQQALIHYPDIRYFLIDQRYQTLLVSKPVQTLFQRWQQEGKIEQIFDVHQLVLYQIMVPLSDLDFN